MSANKGQASPLRSRKRKPTAQQVVEHQNMMRRFVKVDDPKVPQRTSHCHCGKVGHRVVGKQVFCLDHESEAFALQAKAPAPLFFGTGLS